MVMLIKGMMVGLIVAMPLGPTGCLCLDHGVRRGFIQSMFAGLGAALADTIFGLGAHIGVAAIEGWLNKLHMGLALVGGGMLVYMGVKKLKAPPIQTLQIAGGPAQGAAFAGTFLFTLANPLTIFGMTTLMASIGCGVGDNPVLTGSFLLSGVFVGAFAWYLVLAGISLALRSTLSLRLISILQRVTGGMILGTGGLLLVKGILLVGSTLSS